MLKLREAFSQKIQLHIRQDMLQRLWDKYVPSDSADYGNIQLVYLGMEAGKPEEQSRKIQLLISLVLGNRIMCMGLEKAPIKTALVQEQMKNSFQRMERYYLMQLKCCDFVMFRKVSRYVELLDQTQAEDRRYRSWQKESQAIEKQREEYRLFSLFSSEIKEFLKERSFEAMRSVERELLYALSEKEYQKLAERLIWQERETFLSRLEKCDRLQYNKIIKRLEKSSKELSIRLFQSWVKGQGMETVRALDSYEYLLFYQRAVSVVNEAAADSQPVVWKKNKEKMLRYVKRQEPEKILSLLQQMEQFAEEISVVSDENTEQFAAVFSEKLMQLEEQYFQQVIKELRERAVSVLNDRTYQAIAQQAQHFLWQETPKKPVGENELPAGEERHRGESRFLTVGVSQIEERIEQELTLKQEWLEERQAQIFVTYQNEYREVLGTINRALQEQNDILQFSKEVFSVQYKGKLVKEIFQSQHRGEFSEEEIERICELGRVFAEPLAMEEGQEITSERFALSWHTDEQEVQMIQQAIADIREQKEEKQSEFIGNLAEAMFIWEQVYISEQQISRMVEELSGQVTVSQNSKEGQIQLIGRKIMEFSLLQREEESHAAEQIQLIGRKITESFLQGADGEQVIRQIQIPGKKIQRIILRRIRGEQGKTYIQITEEKIKDIYLKKIEENQKETIRKSEEQRLERIFTKISEKVVEEIFQSQHRGEFNEEEIKRICELGRVLAEPIAIEEGLGITGEMFILPRHTAEWETQQVQQAVSYLQELEEEKQSEFIGSLAEAMFIWEQAYVSGQQISRTVEELSGKVSFMQNAQDRVEKGQIQQIGKKIEEIFLRGIEGEQGKGQIQIPAKKIQQIISRHIEGEQGETYIQIAEQKIREFYLKDIEKSQKETIRKSEEQRLERIFTRVSEKVVEEIFQSQHRGEFSEEEIERICELGGLFAEPIAREDSQGITDERLALPRHMDERETQQVQQAISYLQELEEEKQSEFIGNLAEAMFIWEQAHVLGQQISRTVEELSEQASLLQDAQGRVEEGQIQQIVKKIEETLLRGTERGQGKGQIQISEKKIKKIVSRHIEGEHRETYIQITEQKIRELYLKDIEENQKETIRKTEEQRLGLTFTQVLEKVVEEIFRDQHRGEFSEEEIERICKLGRLFAEPLAIAEEQEITGEKFAAAWHTDEWETQRMQQALAYLREPEEEKQPWVIENLAEAMSIWEQVHVSAQQISRTVEELSGWDLSSQNAQGKVEEGQIQQIESKIKEILLQKIDTVKSVHAPYSKLWEWGRALLFHQKLPVSGNARIEEMYDLDNVSQEKVHDTDNVQQKDMQTDIIRRQIEAAKDKNSLRQLIVQINHQAFSRQKTQEDILVYADSQLHEPPVQDLLRYLRQLDEGQYGNFVRQMSKVMEIQWQLHDAVEKTERNAANPQEGAEMSHLQPQGSAEKMQGEAEIRYLQPQGSAEKMQGEAEIRYLQPQGNAANPQEEAEMSHLQPQGSAANPQMELGRITVWQTQDSQRLAAAYPELAVRIQEFERQRSQLTQKRIQAARQKFIHRYDIQKTALEAADTGAPDLWQLMSSAEKDIRAWELQYSVQNADVSYEEQQRDKMRMNEEAIQMKSAQEQLGKKLQEVETQLKKVETAAKAKEDVRAFADQVKRQLYEELHVEKLRRGLI